MRDLRKVGRVGGKALLYFEIVTSFALALGLIVVNVTKPGAGLDESALGKGDVSKYAEAGRRLIAVN
jgi:aerobic C4-dicarboxylate transport protein